MAKKILITGGGGQVGSILHSYLKNSYKIINTSRTGVSDSFKLDISNRLEVENIFKISSLDFNIVSDSPKNIISST